MPKSSLLAQQVKFSVRHQSTLRDRVYINNLNVPKIVVGLNNWNVIQPQDVQINLEMATDFSRASQNDDLNYSLNYAVISRDIGERLSSQKFQNLFEMGSFLGNHLVKQYKGIELLKMSCGLLQGDIRCKKISVSVLKDSNTELKTLHLQNLEVLTLIGVFTFERLQKQYVTLDIEVPLEGHAQVNYREMITSVWKYLEAANFKTVESLVERTSQLLIQKYDLPTITVKVIKLNAITDTDGVGVSCIRRSADFQGLPLIETAQQTENNDAKALHETVFDLPVPAMRTVDFRNSIVFVAFGSNMNTKLENIVQAVAELEQVEGNCVLDISSMYESEPMYFEDQELFYNGIVKLQTDLSPHDLLALCKKIEYEILQRVKKFDNGPRTIDLDIVLYLDSNGDHVVLNDKDLIIPHPRMLERGFVMAPLSELVGESELKHPISTEPLHAHYKQLVNSPNGLGLHKILPLAGNNKLKFNLPLRPTTLPSTVPLYPMYVVNVTPDSFSDGNSETYMNFEQTMSDVSKQVASALSVYPEMEKVIVDIGGCSTKPNSVQIDEESEIERVLPLLKLINENKELRSKIVISLDTYRPRVARVAMPYIDIINDISGDTLGQDASGDTLWKVVGENPQVGYVLSHIRGDISSMSKMNDYSSTNEKDQSLTSVVCSELNSRLQECLQAGVRRWQIILDPGLGFAKTGMQNIEMLKNLPLFRERFSNYPILLGPSRKKFLGLLTNESDPSNRDVETMALVSKLAVDNSCDIVRIHSLTSFAKTLKVIDSLK